MSELISVCCINNTELALELIENKARLNVHNGDEWTALMHS